MNKTLFPVSAIALVLVACSGAPEDDSLADQAASDSVLVDTDSLGDGLEIRANSQQKYKTPKNENDWFNERNRLCGLVSKSVGCLTDFCSSIADRALDYWEFPYKQPIDARKKTNDEDTRTGDTLKREKDGWEAVLADFLKRWPNPWSVRNPE
jgi:hypothetical protein